MRLRVYHTTRYSYPIPAKESHNEARLMPITDDDQSCLDFRLSTTPATPIFAYDLPTGRVHNFNIRAPHSELIIRAESLVVTYNRNPFGGLQLIKDDTGYYRQPKVRQAYAEYLLPTERVPLYPETDRIANVARRQAGVGAASFIISLTRLMRRVLTYAPGSTNVNTSLQHVLEQKQGVCQDFAHLMLAVCRRQGIPSRYVSGYLYTGGHHDDSAPEEAPPPEARASGARGLDDATALVSGNAMHAWVECLLPDGKWHGFDPTNNLITNDFYVKVHVGRDYGDVPPLRGLFRGPIATTMEIDVRVVSDAPH